MKITVDTSELDQFIKQVESVNFPEINKDFIEDEFGIFVDKVVPETPVDTEDMMNAYKNSGTKQKGSITEQDWSNEKEYSSYVNYGTTKISPRYFWEKGMNHAEQNRESRYQEKLAKKLEG